MPDLPSPTPSALHHVELWTADLATTEPAWHWLLDSLRDKAAEHGWQELFSERYPHAGGEAHVAWYAEDPEGIEVEIVALG